MTEFLDTFLLTYAALFPIVNPVGSAPIFLGLTRSISDAERHALARRVAISSFVLLLGSLVIGSHVLGFFGISLPVVRIGGGLVVTVFGWKMLNSDERPDREAAGTAKTVPDAFYPLTMPLTVGPGSMSVAITLGSQRPKLLDLPHLLLLGGAAIAGLIAIAATIYLCYRLAEDGVAKLGSAGVNVVVRLSAFILLCIGIQIMWGGWSELTAIAH